MTSDNGVVLDVDTLRMQYDTNEVLRDVTFQARRGEVLVMLGPNGAGKTTTIEILEGFRGRSAGRVEVLGVDPEQGDEQWRARIGVVLQSWRDHAKWRVRELLAHLGAYCRPYSTDRVQRRWDTESTKYVHELFKQHGESIADLEVRRASLEDTYMTLVKRAESGEATEPVHTLAEVTR
ncbi:argK family protein [Rhodococcus sp. MTM3W5.2]|uniref:ATP-binding cassette domain-containing protein n=1 Tax=Rhodococcus sp. MTM3W5.2 TaxID=1805827 RepID=UPI00097928BD|nr:ATP-binding cassette domain-containing protein [Rhodococcus sp. MTM3W5.2]AQA22846.1 argK family protein [Rhodococcus sp. MTM3W5.2]